MPTLPTSAGPEAGDTQVGGIAPGRADVEQMQVKMVEGKMQLLSRVRFPPHRAPQIRQQPPVRAALKNITSDSAQTQQSLSLGSVGQSQRASLYPS